MKTNPIDIFKEYQAAVDFKASIGSKGLYEQNKINERFYVGDQWHGAKCGAERPLVRHNIIKRIGEFKMSQIMAAPLSVTYSADGVPCTEAHQKSVREVRKKLSEDGDFTFSGTPDHSEINVVTSAFSDYHRATCERVGFSALLARALKNAYISGSGIIYTYWNGNINTGLYGGTAAIKGDIDCEVLKIENVAFGDPYEESIERQPYIILSVRKYAGAVRREAECAGTDTRQIAQIVPDGDDGKVLVLTKLYKEYKSDGSYKIKCVKVTKEAVVREPFSTGLNLYPLAIYRFEERDGQAYGESEITHLIPNQIAINRMITANVWASMTMGMPMMVVNGDTVTGDITNDPGQIIKVYGSNEDVAGAVKYITPPDFSSDFTDSVNNLIDNTLTQSGANAAALGDSDPNNASAIVTLRNAAIMPLSLSKTRFYAFVEQISRIWADFWVTQYGNRKIKVRDENGVWYLPFCSERYRGLYLNARVDVGADNSYSANEQIDTLGSLFEKGIIDRRQYLKRLPKGSVPDINGLLNDINEGEVENSDSK